MQIQDGTRLITSASSDLIFLLPCYRHATGSSEALARNRAVIAAGTSLDLLCFSQLKIRHRTHPRREQQAEVLRFTQGMLT